MNRREFGYFVDSGIKKKKKKQSMKIFLFWLKGLPQNYLVHLKTKRVYTIL